MNETIFSDNGKWELNINQSTFDNGRNVKTVAMLIFAQNRIPVRVITRWNMSEDTARRMAQRMIERANNYTSVIGYDWGIK